MMMKAERAKGPDLTSSHQSATDKCCALIIIIQLLSIYFLSQKRKGTTADSRLRNIYYSYVKDVWVAEKFSDKIIANSPLAPALFD